MGLLLVGLSVGCRWGTAGEGKDSTAPLRVRLPAVAGGFYERQPFALEAQVGRFLREAGPPAVTGRLVAAVVPHAGYIFSGRCAAHAYSLVHSGALDRVVVLGTAHRAMVRGVSLPDPAVGVYRTPLGDVPIDREACAALRGRPGFAHVPGADEVEHSIEVQLPFLQKTAGPFRLVPLLCGYVAPEDVEPTARAIAPLLGERTLLLASSDFTHYGPNYDFVPFGAPVREQLYGWLTNATWAILRLDQAAWQQHCRERRDTICGQVPISLLIAALARRGSPVRGYLLDAYTSGDVVDDFRNSVSYAAVGFLAVESAEAAATPAARAAAGRDEVKEGTMKTATQGGSGKGFSISAPNQKRLLELARRSIEEFLAYCRDKRVDPREEYRGRDFGKPGPFLKQYLPRVATTVAELAEEEMTRPAAVFVTLTRAGELRGCIGCTEPMGPLREVVPYFAVAAATGDSRFDSMGPMTTQELAKIHVEVSVLSPMQRVKSADDIQPKVHGVVVRRGWHQGLFLPQVWEHFATREGFLAELCLQKAHLDPAAWKDPETELLTFTVFAFEESR